MTAKIFIANRGLGEFEFHTYLVYDVDGDMNTINDQKILSGHPDDGFTEPPLGWGGPIVIEVEFVNADSEDTLDTDGDTIDDETPTDRDYTEVDLNGQSAATVWAQMVAFAPTLQGSAAETDADGRLVTDFEYGTLGRNSNSVVATLMSIAGIDFGTNMPTGGITADFPGHDALLSGSGDDYLRGWDGNDVFFDAKGGNDLYHGGDGTNLVRSDNADGLDSVYFDGYESVRVNTATDLSSWQAEQVLDSVTYTDTLQSVEWFASENFLIDNEIDLEDNDQGVTVEDDDEEGLLLVQGSFGETIETSVKIDVGSGMIVSFSNFGSFIGTDYADSFVLRHVIGRNFDGGDGVDTISYAGASNGISIHLAGGQGSDSVGTDTFSSIENATGSDFEDYLYGDSGNNVLDGGLGPDTFFASEGDDTYIGGSGDVDIIDLSQVSQAVTVSGSEFVSDDNSIAGDFDNIEQILLGSSDDIIYGAYAGTDLITINASDGSDTVHSEYDVLVNAGSFVLERTSNLTFVGSTLVLDAEKLISQGGTAHILALGHEYESAGSSTEIYDYSNYGASLEFTIDGPSGIGTVFDGTDTDTYSAIYNDEFIGSNNGDIVSLEDFNALSDLFWLGTGNDTVTLQNSTAIYTGGSDALVLDSFTVDAAIIFSPFIEASDVSFNETNYVWNSIPGGRTGGYDLVVNVAGYGSITIPSAGLKTQGYGTDGVYDTGDDVIIYYATDFDLKLWDGRYYEATSGYALSGSATISTNVATPYDDVLTATLSSPDLNGGSGDDVLTGDANENEIIGGVGIDTIEGLGGDDLLYGGFGDDTIYGGSGYNTLSGGDGDDKLYAEAGDGVLIGGTGSDTYYVLDDTSNLIYGEEDVGAGVNNIVLVDIASTALYDTLMPSFFGVNNDLFELTNSSSNFYLSADIRNFSTITFSDEVFISVADLKANSPIFYNVSSGDDYVDASGSLGLLSVALLGGSDTFIGTAYGDIIYGNEGVDVLGGSSGDDFLDGGDGEDTIDGGDDDDEIYGGEGNDLLIGGGGYDLLNGGNGIDTVSYAAATTAVGVNLSTGITNSGVGSDTLLGIENIVGSSHNDGLTGDGNANYIGGGNGNDTINGGAGNDILDGGGATDTLTYAGASAGIAVNLALATAQNTGVSGTDTISNFENLTGSSYGDTLTGNANANTINGGDGNDTIEGGAGNDTLNGGNGTDTVSYAAASAAIAINLAVTTGQNTGGAGTDTISSFENLTGSDFNDTLTGNLGANTINGGDGNDTINGGAGNDTLNGGNGTDTLSYANSGGVTVDLGITTGQNTGGAGTDTISNFENLTGSSSSDTLTGDSSANTIKGGSGTDTINGGDGDDILYGGAGSDTITGSTGGDVFIFEIASAFSAVDTVTDFGAGDGDKFDFHDILDAVFDPVTMAIADFVNFTTSGANSVLSIDRDGTGATYSFTDVANVTGGAGLDETTLYANGNLLVA